MLSTIVPISHWIKKGSYIAKIKRGSSFLDKSQWRVSAYGLTTARACCYRQTRPVVNPQGFMNPGGVWHHATHWPGILTTYFEAIGFCYLPRSGMVIRSVECRGGGSWDIYILLVSCLKDCFRWGLNLLHAIVATPDGCGGRRLHWLDISFVLEVSSPPPRCN